MDPIANILTIIRNAYLAKRKEVTAPHSRIKESLVELLKEAGFVTSYSVEGEIKKTLKIELNYPDKKASLTHIRRISKPSIRTYAKAGKLPLALNGRGMLILSTSKGLMTDRTARKEGLGGEVICEVW